MTNGENLKEEGSKDRKKAVPKQAGVEDTSDKLFDAAD